jgi:hypothetical protein
MSGLTISTPFVIDQAINRIGTATLASNGSFTSATSPYTALTLTYVPDTTTTYILIWFTVLIQNASLSSGNCYPYITRYQGTTETTLFNAAVSYGYFTAGETKLFSGIAIDTIGNTTTRDYRVRAATTTGSVTWNVLANTTLVIKEIKK